MKLAATEYIVTAYAQVADGPGWSNRPLWVVIKDRLDGSIRQDCIQPSEQTHEMHLLYEVSQVVHTAMTRVVEAAVVRPKKNTGARRER